MKLNYGGIFSFPNILKPKGDIYPRKRRKNIRSNFYIIVLSFIFYLIKNHKPEQVLHITFKHIFQRLSGKLPSRKNCPPVRVRVWFRISIRIRAGGQLSSGAIFLEPFQRVCLNYLTAVYI